MEMGELARGDIFVSVGVFFGATARWFCNQMPIGWDGYPRSYSRAMALETLGICPDIFVVLDANLSLLSHYQNVEPLLSKCEDAIVKVGNLSLKAGMLFFLILSICHQVILSQIVSDRLYSDT